ncbi:hypothetical protein [Acaryochloris marina]|uniref:NurA domain-containing protein n=1 Tax=Acaryochloris marina (strain MBIC 11017) TaxID=329726 RepID=B0C373_ACAM1|nr:hypothetical protein [Acaryochloris marina]ABW27420.1 conserved hypothetical protein [Acaryochloris marina MBIC11017]BDM82160.1 hypothetical protein AM10699_50240 [Acaryochloris marina MBIC10699]
MIDPESHEHLSTEIANRIAEDREILEQLRSEIRPLKSAVRRIQARTTTSVSLVGTDGGNNRIQYDPFLVQLIRVVDSSNNEYCLEAITPTTKVSSLSNQQFDKNGEPLTALGKMMDFLGVRHISDLSPMIRSNDDGELTSTSWVQVYRELVEWAVLFSVIREKEFAVDTLIVFDGLLRSKVFKEGLFQHYRKGIQEAIDSHRRKSRRKIYLVGFAKHSKVLTRYRLAMALENILTSEYPAYVDIPPDIEEKAYIWSEYARNDDIALEQGGEINKFVGGKMFFIKFGNKSHDPIWPVDIFLPQAHEAQAIIGYLLSDAINGFPVPFYPRCLQKAHENAALVDFDFDVLQDQIFNGIRNILGQEAVVLDMARLQDPDPAQNRY